MKHYAKDKSLFHEIIGTGFFTGYLPIAPGTAGSWTAACLLWILTHFFMLSTWQVSLFGASICLILGVYSSNYLVKISGEKDPSYIVIDEFAGVFLCYTLVPLTTTNFFLGFLFFRIFDIVKPWPIRRIEAFRDGWGIMLDDIAAGVYAGVVLFCVQFFG